MQSADILIYRASHVPVGEDQVPHIEITREVARRFNHLFGREPGFADKVKAAVAKLGKSDGRTFELLRKRYGEAGDADSLAEGRQLLANARSLGAADRERLLGHLTGSQRQILVEPGALLTDSPRLPGLDGAKMSKSYGNTITLREDPASVSKKIRGMTTDPARVRRNDPGDPEKCPVWELHKVYSSAGTKQWVVEGCTTAGIGCLDCKQPLIDAIVAELTPMRERAQRYLDHPALLREIVDAGCDKARVVARETMREVREAMGLVYA
jgi:tryptophanyl-tRNA synthetase